VDEEIREIWEAGARADSSIRLRDRHIPLLRAKRVLPEPWSRARLFEKMMLGEPVLFTGFTLPVATRNGENKADAIAEMIRTGFPKKTKAYVQCGPARSKSRMHVPDIMRRWSGRRALISVIDLHFRGTRLATQMALETLSDFNVLITGTDEMAEQEMMTVVIGSAGNVTSAHTDDPDGSNHCFTGRKFWMTWESFEGSAKGIQDDSRDDCGGRPRFDVDDFLTVDSARWWTVTEGQTLFLPGKMAHRVITLEHYLGVGSFYLGLPGCLQNISRWHQHEPIWLTRNPKYTFLLGEITRAVTSRIRMLRHATDADRERWGIAYVRETLARWEREEPEERQRELLADPDFAELVEAAREVG
jgi:hypothetical protein